VTGLVLELPVHMTHELLRREPAVALQALDAGRLLVRVHVGGADALALAKALVIDVEAQRSLGQALDRDVAIPVRSVEQSRTKSLRVGSGDQPAGLDVRRQDLGGLELHQLIGRALRAVYAQLIEDPVDLLQGKVVQDIVEKLGQAKSHFSAHGKASYGFSLQLRLVEFSTTRIRHG